MALGRNHEVKPVVVYGGVTEMEYRRYGRFYFRDYYVTWFVIPFMIAVVIAGILTDNYAVTDIFNRPRMG